MIRFFVRSSPEKRFDKDHRATVWFVTNRKPRLDAGGRAVFHSQESDSLTFGYSTVGIPFWRFLGRIRPRWWERLIGQNQYAVLHHSIITQSDFVDAVKGLADPPGALLFIHGYNTTFDQAVIRCAQLQNDLKISGRVICYSWPSMGWPYGYGADAAIIEESEDSLVELITVIAGSAAYRFLHVLAHSMGNRALLRAISKMQDTGSPGFLSQVILAAPDVGQGLFKKLSTGYTARAKRCTLYASKHDRAMMGSRYLHARGRAGYIPPITLVDRIDTIGTRIGFGSGGSTIRAWGHSRNPHRHQLPDSAGLAPSSTGSGLSARSIPKPASPSGFSCDSLTHCYRPGMPERSARGPRLQRIRSRKFPWGGKQGRS